MTPTQVATRAGWIQRRGYGNNGNTVRAQAAAVRPQATIATACWVHFWNTRRLHSACGDVPPAEFEAAYHYLRAATEAA